MTDREEAMVEEARPLQEDQGQVPQGQPDVENGGKCCAWISR